METRHFRDLTVWQRSMALARGVYALTDAFPKREIFGLTQQIRRSAVSIPSNIAEGRGRATDKNFAVFLIQARGSLYELQTQLELSRDLGFAAKSDADSLIAEAAEISAMIHGLLSALHRSS